MFSFCHSALLKTASHGKRAFLVLQTSDKLLSTEDGPHTVRKLYKINNQNNNKLLIIINFYDCSKTKFAVAIWGRWPSKSLFNCLNVLQAHMFTPEHVIFKRVFQKAAFVYLTKTLKLFIIKIIIKFQNTSRRKWKYSLARAKRKWKKQVKILSP